jgi:hypothetical protein
MTTRASASSQPRRSALSPPTLELLICADMAACALGGDGFKGDRERCIHDGQVIATIGGLWIGTPE